jgi:hypothetical protein
MLPPERSGSRRHLREQRAPTLGPSKRHPPRHLPQRHNKAARGRDAIRNPKRAARQPAFDQDAGGEDMKGRIFGVVLGTLALAAPAQAGETITYSYDALGRLTGTSHSGTINNGLKASYTYDAADNRTNVTVTGASRNVVIVVPLNGFTIIPVTVAQ